MTRETGFPSPAQGYEAKTINLNDELVMNPESTYLMRVESNKMKWRGVLHKSVLIVDRSILPKSGDLVVAYLDGELLCREYFEDKQKKGLYDGESRIFPSVEDFIFGTVISIITKLY